MSSGRKYWSAVVRYSGFVRAFDKLRSGEVLAIIGHNNIINVNYDVRGKNSKQNVFYKWIKVLYN